MLYGKIFSIDFSLHSLDPIYICIGYCSLCWLGFLYVSLHCFLFVSLFYQIWMPFARISRKNRKMCTRRLSHSIPTIGDFSLNEHLNRLHTVHRSLFHTLCWLFNKSLSIYKMSIIIISGVDLRDVLLFSRTGIWPNKFVLSFARFSFLKPGKTINTQTNK